MLPGDDGKDDDLLGGKGAVHAAKVVCVLAVAVDDDREQPVSWLGLVRMCMSFNISIYQIKI